MAMPVRRNGTQTSVNGSVGLTSYKRLVKTRVKAAEPARLADGHLPPPVEKAEQEQIAGCDGHAGKVSWLMILVQDTRARDSMHVSHGLCHRVGEHVQQAGTQLGAAGQVDSGVEVDVVPAPYGPAGS